MKQEIHTSERLKQMTLDGGVFCKNFIGQALQILSMLLNQEKVVREIDIRYHKVDMLIQEYVI